MRLGKRQIDLLMKLGTTRSVVLPDNTTRRLVELGLAHAEPNGSFTRITPAGLRALADLADAGKVEIPLKLPTKEPGK